MISVNGSSAPSSSSTPELDLVFLCDCTSSMSSYIESAKASICKIMETIQASEKRDVQFALISYRDHTDDYVTKVFPFTGSVKKAKEYVNTMSAHGGGDTPEAVADALADALALPYRKSSTKIVVIVADAPPHGVGFGNDSYPEGSPKGHDPIAIAQEMAKREIVVYSVGCEPQLGRTPFAQDLFKGLSQITGGRYVALGNSKILPDVIIGGAEEEMKLEKVRAQIEEETKAVEKEETEKNGGKPVEATVLATKVTERLQTKGITTAALEVGDIGGGSEKTEASNVIAQCNTLPEARKLLKQMAPPPQQQQQQMRAVSYGAPARDASSFAYAPPPASAAPRTSYASQEAKCVTAPISYAQVERMQKRSMASAPSKSHK